MRLQTDQRKSNKQQTTTNSESSRAINENQSVVPAGSVTSQCDVLRSPGFSVTPFSLALTCFNEVCDWTHNYQRSVTRVLNSAEIRRTNCRNDWTNYRNDLVTCFGETDVTNSKIEPTRNGSSHAMRISRLCLPGRAWSQWLDTPFWLARQQTASVTQSLLHPPPLFLVSVYQPTRTAPVD